jgi:hypothetical protein
MGGKMAGDSKQQDKPEDQQQLVFTEMKQQKLNR